MPSSRRGSNTDRRLSGERSLRSVATGSRSLPKHTAETVERLVQELMNLRLTKAERMRRLRELVLSGEDVPDELMNQALRRLMERLTD